MISASEISDTGLAARRFSDSESDEDDVIPVSDDDGAEDDADGLDQYASSQTRWGVIILLTKRLDGRASASDESEDVSEIWAGFVTTNCWLNPADGWWTISPKVVRW